ncbi:hypothetical protein ACQ4LK_22480, partial [Bacillus pumilus]
EGLVGSENVYKRQAVINMSPIVKNAKKSSPDISSLLSHHGEIPLSIAAVSYHISEPTRPST